MRGGLGWAVALSLLVSAAPAQGFRPATPAPDDEQFLSLLEGAAGEALDTRRLARLLFSVGAELDGGRPGVVRLQNMVFARDPTGEAEMRRMLRAQHEAYATAVDRYREHVALLLDAPESALRLYRVLTDGHEACWRLAALVRLSETYGARPADVMTVLPSTEACARFRRAALQDEVQDLVVRELDEAAARKSELAALREELAELEHLLEDLRSIEEPPP